MYKIVKWPIVICAIIIMASIAFICYTNNESNKHLKFFEGNYSEKMCDGYDHEGKNIPADGGMQYLAFASGDHYYYCKDCYKIYWRAPSSSTSKSESKSEWHKCSYYGCNDGSYELEIDGHYWCFEHYNKYLFSGGFS